MWDNLDAEHFQWAKSKSNFGRVVVVKSLETQSHIAMNND
jgi:hypothetical protein